MAAKDPLHNKIRQSFESQQRQAPEGLWDKISGHMDNDTLDQSLKNAFENRAAQAPESIWQGVQKELDIEAGWRGVLRYLNRQKWQKKLIQSTAVLMLLFLLGYWGWQQQKDPSSEAQSGQKSNYPSHRIDASEIRKDRQPALSEKPAVVNKPGLSTPAASGGQASRSVQKPEDKLATGIASENRTTISNKIQRKARAPSQESARPAVVPVHSSAKSWISIRGLSRVAELSPLHGGSKRATYQESDRKIRFATGVRLGSHRSWLRNNDYRRGRDQRSLVVQLPSYTVSYAVEQYLQWSPRHQVALRYTFQNAHEQQYRTYEEGYFIEKRLRLNYWQGSLHYGFRFSIASQKAHHPFVIQTGLYYAGLKAAVEQGPQGTRNLSRQYEADYGLLLSIGHEIKSQGLILSYGLQGQYGLKNLYAGDGKSSPLFDRTDQRQLGLYLGLRYPF